MVASLRVALSEKTPQAIPPFPGISLRGQAEVLRGASTDAVTVQTKQHARSCAERDVRGGDSFPAEDQLRALLLGASPTEVLARIATDDPLRLRPAVVERLRQRGQLLDASRVHLRCLALCAREACRYQGAPSLKQWLLERVDEAIEQVLGEDNEVEVQDGVWAPLAAPLGLEPRAAREACTVLNGLPIQERLAFFRIVIEREDTGRAARELEVEEDELLRSARSALEQLIRWLETSAREEG